MTLDELQRKLREIKKASIEAGDKYIGESEVFIDSKSIHVASCCPGGIFIHS